MRAFCPECAGGPHDIGGHAAMVISHEKGTQLRQTPVFQCARCGRLWLRTYVGGGGFGWQDLETRDPVSQDIVASSP